MTCKEWDDEDEAIIDDDDWVNEELELVLAEWEAEALLADDWG